MKITKTGVLCFLLARPILCLEVAAKYCSADNDDDVPMRIHNDMSIPTANVTCNEYDDTTVM